MSAQIDTTAWRQALAAHAVHTTPPVKDRYVWNRWHHARVSLRGYRREVRAHLGALVRPAAEPRKFLVVGLPRSGTTLLTRLINQVPDMRCDGEVLSRAVWAPHLFLNRLARNRGLTAYGSKLLTYQLFEVQMLRDVPGFFQSLVADGYVLIHLRRDTFKQTVSLATARETSSYHITPQRDRGAFEVTLDQDAFLTQYRYSEMMLDYEDLLFSGLPHLRLQYEQDLTGPAAHQATVDRICAQLDMPTAPVQADTTPTSGRSVITNLDVLREHVDRTGQGQT